MLNLKVSWETTYDDGAPEIELTFSRRLVLCYIYWRGLCGNGIISVSAELPVPRSLIQSWGSRARAAWALGRRTCLGTHPAPCCASGDHIILCVIPIPLHFGGMLVTFSVSVYAELLL